ncbi:MAG: hypothetical protein MUC87_18035 [Bacteroidia bacterium]|jgi:hypothetical protein|nr:hypothetical protein [Bacteroidia bacterium]
MEEKTTYGHQETTSFTGELSSDGLYRGLSIDPDDLRLLNSIYPLWRELSELREKILSKYHFSAGDLSVAPAPVACILRHPHKFTDEQLSRFIQFIYYERIIKNLSSPRSAIEALHPRFSSKPQFISLKQLESNVPSATLIHIFNFLSDRFVIIGNLQEILPQHFLSNAGTGISIKTIQKYIGSRKKEYPLDPFLKAKLEAIFP